MVQHSLSQKGRRLTLLSLVLVSIYFHISLFDPINLPKFFLLVITSFSILPLLIFSFLRIAHWKRADYLIIWLSINFMIAICFTMIHSRENLASQIYGEFGRYTGLITYLALIILHLAGYRFFSGNTPIFLLKALIAVGFFNSTYGLLQWMQLDFVSWSISTSKVIGTFGNSNFLSAVLGLASTASLAFVVGNQKTATRLGYFMMSILMITVIVLTQSIQGLLIIAVGLLVIIYKRFLVNQKVLTRFIYFVLVAFLSISVLFGVINKGFLKQALFQDSTVYRIDYWKAAIKMALDSPYFGLGLDTFGSYYREYRGADAASRRGVDQVSNSAHNLLLELLSSGGILLLFSFLLIFTLSAKAFYRIITKSTSYDELGVGLCVVWLGYLFQSMINVSNIGIAAWGWIISGSLIAYDQSMSSKVPPNIKESRRKIEDKNQASIHNGAILLCVLAGVYIAIWPIIQEQRFTEALSTGNTSLLVKSTKTFPHGQRYGELAAKILLENGFNEEARKVADYVIQRNERAYDAYLSLISNPLIDKESRQALIIKLIEIEPNFPQFAEK